MNVYLSSKPLYICVFLESPEVIILPVSFAAIAEFSFVFVIPDTHLPASK
jgi:hypothetical protein